MIASSGASRNRFDGAALHLQLSHLHCICCLPITYQSCRRRLSGIGILYVSGNSHGWKVCCPWHVLHVFALTEEGVIVKTMHLWHEDACLAGYTLPCPHTIAFPIVELLSWAGATHVYGRTSPIYWTLAERRTSSRLVENLPELIMLHRSASQTRRSDHATYSWPVPGVGAEMCNILHSR
jgi:hypothetical protein